MNKLVNIAIGLIFNQLQMDISVKSYYGSNKLNLTGTCSSGLRKLKLNWNKESVSALLKLYRNLLHQVSGDWNFAETFQYVSALLKRDWNLLHQVSGNWNFAETFSLFPYCWNLIETYTSGFHWQKLDWIQLKLYNSFRIAETI